MRVYADTNFFTNVWATLMHSEEAQSLLTVLLNEREQLPVTWLVRVEFTNALQRLVYESRHGTQSVHLSPEAALLARAQFEDEMQAGDLLKRQAMNGEELENAFDTLAFRHTARHGFRTYDILHVASALLLGCDTFWSFDTKARKLAELEGLRTN
jgi:predicted nucleic acid-binding protein